MRVGGGWNAVRGDLDGSDMFEKYACLKVKSTLLTKREKAQIRHVPRDMNTRRVLSPGRIHFIDIIAGIALEKRISSLFRQLTDFSHWLCGNCTGGSFGATVAKYLV